MLAMEHGDYIPEGNGLRTVTGDEAVLQRVLMKLTARRGKFPFWEDFGSQLWRLGTMRAVERQTAAAQYVAEALSDEEGMTVESVTLTPEGDGRTGLTAVLRRGETHLTAEVTL